MSFHHHIFLCSNIHTHLDHSYYAVFHIAQRPNQRTSQWLYLQRSKTSQSNRGFPALAPRTAERLWTARAARRVFRWKPVLLPAGRCSSPTCSSRGSPMGSITDERCQQWILGSYCICCSVKKVVLIWHIHWFPQVPPEDFDGSCKEHSCETDSWELAILQPWLQHGRLSELATKEGIC